MTPVALTKKINSSTVTAMIKNEKKFRFPTCVEFGVGFGSKSGFGSSSNGKSDSIRH